MNHLPEGLPELPSLTRWNETGSPGCSIEESPDGWLVMYEDAREAMRAYGIACYQAALEKAAAECERVTEEFDDYTVSDDWPDPEVVTDKCAAAIRSLKQQK